MIRRRIQANLFPLGALLFALWLGLWPAVEAVTPVPEKPAPEVAAMEPSSCCEDTVKVESCACCDLGCVSAGETGCSRPTAASNCQCSGSGSQVFLATAWSSADLRLVPVGNVDPTDQVSLSRMIQPPVPPPLPELPTIG